MDTETLQEKASEAFCAFIRAHGLRNTAERSAILNAVCNLPGHFDIDTLQHELAMGEHISVSRATLYNTLNLLERAGLVEFHHFDDRPTLYECSYGATGRNHLLCTECGRIMPLDDAGLRTTLEGLSTPGFHPTGYSVEIYGLCDRCQNKRKDSATAATPRPAAEKNNISHFNHDKRQS